MWREIKCGGGWPSGSDGDWCKVWWLDWTGWKWRQGVWDPDQGYCIITSGQAPNNGCTDDRRESTASGIADLCPGNTAGDGKCEQACGADASCDEKDTGDTCGTNGRCASYCLCCEGSDSDGGKVYTVKGTTSGYYQGSCQSFNDTCVWELGKLYLQEYFISDRRINSELYDCSQRTDGSIRCIDGRCGCMYDSDCPPNDKNIVGRCCSPSGTGCPNRQYDYTCKYKESCGDRFDCIENYCCSAEIGITPGVCEPLSTVKTLTSKSYLCVAQ